MSTNNTEERETPDAIFERIIEDAIEKCPKGLTDDYSSQVWRHGYQEGAKAEYHNREIRSEIPQWEYKLVQLQGIKKFFGLFSYITEEKTIELLDELGSYGWELCTERPMQGKLMYIFKRRIN